MKLKRHTLGTGIAGLFLAFVLSALTGCATAPVLLAPGAEQVQITRDPAEAVGCDVKGTVQTPGELDPASQLNELKNETFALGANLLFDTTKDTRGTQVMNALFLPGYVAASQNEKLRRTSGVAYYCDREKQAAVRQAMALEAAKEGELTRQIPEAQRLKPLPNYHIETELVETSDGSRLVRQRYVHN